LFVNHTLKNTTQVYGFFGFVLGLLAWIYLGAQILLLGAEINVVRAKRLWPRSLRQEPPIAEADRRALTRRAAVEERVEQESIDVSFDQGDETGDARAAGGLD
jgi:hypothetical protein